MHVVTCPQLALISGHCITVLEIAFSPSWPDLLCRPDCCSYYTNQHVWSMGSVWCFLLSLTALLKTNNFCKRVILKFNTVVFYFLNISQIPVVCGLSSASPKILICDCTFAKRSGVIENFYPIFSKFQTLYQSIELNKI